MDKLENITLTKLYYSIGEVATIFDVNSSLIRFWEKEFNLIQPKKNAKGNRLFTPKDILVFNKIYHLVKIEGYTLDGAKKELKRSTAKNTVSNGFVNDATIDYDAIVYRLEAVRSKLLRMKSN
jgi:DNA-binding transcriptional MerR regulator